MTTDAATIETPTDSPTPPKAKRRKPTAANRFQLFDDEEGDYRIYEIAGAGHAPVPKGSLIPIAGVPGFGDMHIAKRFINNSGNLLEGKQMMIFKGLDICSVDVVTVAKVKVKFKPKKPIGGPAAEGEDGA